MGTSDGSTDGRRRRLRRPVIAGNWKMHKAPTEAAGFLEAFKERYPVREDRSVLLFPPAISLTAAIDAVRDRPDIGIGVQNTHWEREGAFTGEISAAMAGRAGAGFTLVGHSERRHVFGESDDDVRRKTAAAFDAGLTPVVCLGETLDERRVGHVEAVITQQLDRAVDGLDHDRIGSLLLAYEPVWAIGTGETATPDDASAAHAILRARLAERIGEATADAVPILYGGSVKPHNAAELLDAEHVDGVLVGGASLDPSDFAAIANAASAGT
ncbi:MAG: triose-phosphate isomerase [Gemmatimonadota bacterium]